MDHLEIGKTVERKLDGEGGEQETEHHFGNKHAILDQMLAHSSALAKHDDVDCEHHNEQSDDEGEHLGRGDLCRCRHQHHNSSRVEEIGLPQGHDGDLEQGRACRQRPTAGAGDAQDEQLKCWRRAPERGAAGERGEGVRYRWTTGARAPDPASDRDRSGRPNRALDDGSQAIYPIGRRRSRGFTGG